MRWALAGFGIAAFGAFAAWRLAKPEHPGFTTKKDWVINILDGETGKSKAELRAWRFETGEGATCYVFLQKQTNDAWVPTSSCLPSWLLP